MPTYVALLRGISPTNPKTSNAKLCATFAKLGLKEPRPVLASGNVVFASTARSAAALEKTIERGLSDQLGVEIDVLVRGQAELEAMLCQYPFKGAEHGKDLYLTVTFRKDDPAPGFNALKRANMDGPEFMKDLERRYGKRITTRTWNTIGKIAAKMREAK